MATAKLKIEIKSRWTGNVLFEGEYVSTRACLQEAVKQRADLKGADLEGADLKGAYLKGAYLEGAYLKGADLEGADLKGADLKGAYLKGAYLKGADLKGADLEGADLEDIKQDFLARLALAKNEAAGLYDYLMRGRIDGSCYEGECACFCGTIAKIRNEHYQHMNIELKPDSSSATEKWFLAIRKGDTPQSNSVAGITADWLREFMEKNGITTPQYKMVSDAEFPDAFKAA